MCCWQGLRNNAKFSPKTVVNFFQASQTTYWITCLTWAEAIAFLMRCSLHQDSFFYSLMQKHYQLLGERSGQRFIMFSSLLFQLCQEEHSLSPIRYRMLSGHVICVQGEEVFFIMQYSKMTNIKGHNPCILAFLRKPIAGLLLKLFGRGLQEALWGCSRQNLVKVHKVLLGNPDPNPD